MILLPALSKPCLVAAPASTPAAGLHTANISRSSTYARWLAALAAVPTLACHALTLVDTKDVEVTGTPVAFTGSIETPTSLSGIAVSGDYVLVVSDESDRRSVVQVLRKNDAGYGVVGAVVLPSGDEEVDLEAVAVDDGMVYVTGSHSWTRRIERATIEQPRRRKSREQYFRFRLRADGTAGPVEGPRSLHSAIKANAVLSGFSAIASKENGVDIEGLAVKDGRMYFGFRGPVLRGGWVPVMSLRWGDPDAAVAVSYVQLDGRGIRDMAAVKDGFLVLAGPVGDGDMSYRIYFWNGVDQLPLADKALQPQRIAEFANLGIAKPEGLAVINENAASYDVLVISDGLMNGGAMRWTLVR
jgi:Protein of unknown function (DUF3616)